MKELFLKVPYYVSKAHGYYDQQGNEQPLSASDKLIYCYMKQRYDYFSSQGKQHYETQRTISEAIGVNVRTVMRAVKAFLKHGVIEGHKTRLNGSGRERWLYTAVHKLNAYAANPIPIVPRETILGDDDEWAIEF